MSTSSEFNFEVKALYDVLEAALDEAAKYVMANGARKHAEIEDITSTMEYHRREAIRKINKFSEIAQDLQILQIKKPEIFFDNFIADTRLYNHKITRGPRKGQTEERTVSSCRIDGYRRIIAKARKEQKAMSAQDIEKEFETTKAYVEIK